MVEVMGGQLHSILIPIAPSLPHLRSGKLKGLAVGTLKRSALLPELATLDELGVTGFDAANWYSIVAPAKTLPPVMDRLHAEIVKYMTSADTQKRLPAMGVEIDIKTDAEMRKIVPAEIAKWTKVAIAAKMPREH
jgi:tripartite-type tricarboxylate transporter receptor subunit TctC